MAPAADGGTVFFFWIPIDRQEPKVGWTSGQHTQHYTADLFKLPVEVGVFPFVRFCQKCHRRCGHNTVYGRREKVTMGGWMWGEDTFPLLGGNRANNRPTETEKSNRCAQQNMKSSRYHYQGLPTVLLPQAQFSRSDIRHASDDEARTYFSRRCAKSQHAWSWLHKTTGKLCTYLKISWIVSKCKVINTRFMSSLHIGTHSTI